MSYLATVYKVMIACPSDVKEEEQTARKIIYKWNGLHSEREKIALLPISWKTDTAPEMGAPPQEIVDKRILEKADLLVGIFLHRLGTPTLDAQSGTAHEIDSHINSGKPAMIYFLKENIDPTKFDRQQYDKLTAFKENLKNKGVLHECNRRDFENNFLEHLTITINNDEYIQSEKVELKVTNLGDYDDTDEITIGDEAKKLLIEASKDKHGSIMKIRNSGGTFILISSKNMVPSQEARIVAKWEYALNELIENGFVEDRSYKGEVFVVTHKGYKYADKINNK